MKCLTAQGVNREVEIRQFPGGINIGFRYAHNDLDGIDLKNFSHSVGHPQVLAVFDIYAVDDAIQGRFDFAAGNIKGCIIHGRLIVFHLGNGVVQLRLGGGLAIEELFKSFQ